jgi:hypothetical protein
VAGDLALPALPQEPAALFAFTKPQRLQALSVRVVMFRNQTKRENDVSTRGKSVDFVPCLFRSSKRLNRTCKAPVRSVIMLALRVSAETLGAHQRN